MQKNPYEDIIHLPHHVSRKHPRMSLHDRAAQFAPFAALTGYDDVIAEAGRLTDTQAELDESVILEISEALSEIAERLPERPEVEGFVFVPDERKEGGAVTAFSGRVRKLDTFLKELVLTDGSVLPFSGLLKLYLVPGEGEKAPDGIA